MNSQAANRIFHPQPNFKDFLLKIMKETKQTLHKTLKGHKNKHCLAFHTERLSTFRGREGTCISFYACQVKASVKMLRTHLPIKTGHCWIYRYTFCIGALSHFTY